MDIKKYVEVTSTAVYPREVKDFGIAYCFLGIYDELIEVREKMAQTVDSEGIDLEKGDVLWYMLNLSTEVGIDFPGMIETYFEHRTNIVRMVPDNYFGKIKKYYRDGKEIDREHMIEFFFFPLLKFLFNSSSREEFDKIMEMNYNKLMKRRATGTIHGDGDHREDEGAK